MNGIHQFARFYLYPRLSLSKTLTPSLLLGSLKKKSQICKLKKKSTKKNPSNLANPTPQPTHWTNNIGVYYLGATEPCLHSNSKEGRTTGCLTTVQMTLRAITQVVSCFLGKEEDRSPKAIALFDVAIAGSRKGFSISTRKRCLTS